MVASSNFMDNEHVFQWTQPYDLDTLTGTTASNECTTRDWIMSILRRSRHQVSVTAETAMKELKNFSPFNSSTTVIPDVSVVFPYQDKELPVLTIEVQSGTHYNQTVSKAVVNGIEQFRVIRMVCPDFKKCVSYVFPKSNAQHGVTRLNITFHDLKFRIDCIQLEQSDVSRDIRTNLNRVCDDIETSGSDGHDVYPYYVRLSQTECDQISQGSKQVRTKRSIIVHSSDQSKYFKYSPSCEDKYKSICDMCLNCNPSMFRYSSLPTRKLRHLTLPFYEYSALRGPLTRQHCKSCLIPFIEGVKRALEELHGHNIAHLDLLLPNICFEEDGTVVLIDLERCERYRDVERREYDKLSLKFPGSDMYKYEGKYLGNYWKLSQYDWKCLGMLICDVLEPGIPYYHSMVSKNYISTHLRQDPFVKGLLDEGKLGPMVFYNCN